MSSSCPVSRVTPVKRCLRRRRGSITAGHVVRDSAIPAPTTGCQCQSEAGAVPLSGCVRPAISKEGQLPPTNRVRLLELPLPSKES